MDSVLVTPGILPPTMSTTPNSPTACAKVKTSPVRMPGQDSGKATRRNVPDRETPRHHDASTRRRSTAAKAEVNGRIANGMLHSTDPIKMPAKENGKIP